MGVGREAAAGGTAERAAGAAGVVLLTLASAQFLMTLDSSVMNVSIATVAKDVGTTVTGIQTAITFYTLVMASLMITGGKVGQILGRKRAFAIGCVIYGCGSLTTALAPNLAVLIVGWSVLEGIGAALIMPAIVALVASNFARDQRPRAYGLVASAGAIAVAAGPLIGGLFTTYASWRCVFAGEVLVVLIILGAHPPHRRHPARGGRAPRCGGYRAVGAGPGPDCVWGPALGDVGESLSVLAIITGLRVISRRGYGPTSQRLSVCSCIGTLAMNARIRCDGRGLEHLPGEAVEQYRCQLSCPGFLRRQRL
jgi:MFS family permease